MSEAKVRTIPTISQKANTAAVDRHEEKMKFIAYVELIIQSVKVGSIITQSVSCILASKV